MADNSKYIATLQKRVDAINAMEADVEDLGDDELAAKTELQRELRHADSTERAAIERAIALIDDGRMMARARALARRQAGATDARLTVGPLILDTAGFQAWLDQIALNLPRREFACLAILATNANAVVPKDSLISALYDNADPPMPNAVEVIISRLRKRLTHPAIALKTVRGVGYMLLEHER